MRYIIYSLALLVLLIGCGKKQPAPKQRWKPEDGFVPNSSAAIGIAEAVLPEIYGNYVLDEKPFTAELKDEKVWIVYGTLHSQVGGVSYVEIDKISGKIIRIEHGK